MYLALHGIRRTHFAVTAEKAREFFQFVIEDCGCLLYLGTAKDETETDPKDADVDIFSEKFFSLSIVKKEHQSWVEYISAPHTEGFTVNPLMPGQSLAVAPASPDVSCTLPMILFRTARSDVYKGQDVICCWLNTDLFGLSREHRSEMKALHRKMKKWIQKHAVDVKGYIPFVSDSAVYYVA